MPSASVTPASFVIDWGEVATIPARVDVGKLALRLTMGAVDAGPGVSTDLSVTKPTLPRLNRQVSYFDAQGRPTLQMQNFWQIVAEKIEEAFAALTTQVGDNTSLIAAIQATQALAQAANDNATSVTSANDLQSSYTDPQNVLSASNDGTVSIAEHNRVYPVSGTTVAVDSGSLTGLSGTVYPYYMDAGRSGGTVSYQASTSPVVQKGDVHTLGSVTVPAAGEPDTSGGGTPAPGVVPVGGGGYLDP